MDSESQLAPVVTPMGIKWRKQQELSQKRVRFSGFCKNELLSKLFFQTKECFGLFLVKFLSLSTNFFPKRQANFFLAYTQTLKRGKMLWLFVSTVKSIKDMDRGVPPPPPKAQPI